MCPALRRSLACNAHLIGNSMFVITDQVKIKSNGNASLLIIIKTRHQQEGKYDVI